MDFSEESKESAMELLSTLSTVNAVDNGDETTTITFVLNTDPPQEFSTLLPVSISMLFGEAITSMLENGISKTMDEYLESQTIIPNTVDG